MENIDSLSTDPEHDPIPEPIDWNINMLKACEDSNLKSLKSVIEESLKFGYTIFEFDWDKALQISSNLSILELIIEVGECKFDWNAKLQDACLKGQFDVAKLIVSSGLKEEYVFNWNEGMRKACEGCHRDLALYMIDCGANDWIQE